ncbi:MAG: hypothetical protein WBP58_17640 [Chitinophagaceae bacterium]
MYKAKRILEHINGDELDHYLLNGWFRMKQYVFTTEFLQMGLEFYDAIWLRHRLADFQFPKWFRKLQKDNRFRAEITAFHPTPEHELLYQAYRESKPSGFPDSLESILYGDTDHNLFNTRQINVYDGEELIGAGFFDLGHHAAMGIVSYFEPSYSNFSIGKYTTMLKYAYCIEKGLDYYYPGYFAPGNSSFDYKLKFHPASLEFLDMRKQAWLPIEAYKQEDSPLEHLAQELSLLAKFLDAKEMIACLVHNLYFAYLETSRYDCPLALMIYPTENFPGQSVITYDHHTKEYHVFLWDDADFTDILKSWDGRLICMKAFPLKKPVFTSGSMEAIASHLALSSKQS